jgi:hypothetical protein
MDLIAVLIVLAGMHLLRKRLIKHAREYKQAILKVSDFTVYITNLPGNLREDRAEKEISSHFQRLYGDRTLVDAGTAAGLVSKGHDQQKVVARVYPASTSGGILLGVRAALLARQKLVRAVTARL